MCTLLVPCPGACQVNIVAMSLGNRIFLLIYSSPVKTNQSLSLIVFKYSTSNNEAKPTISERRALRLDPQRDLVALAGQVLVLECEAAVSRERKADSGRSSCSHLSATDQATAGFQFRSTNKSQTECLS